MATYLLRLCVLRTRRRGRRISGDQNSTQLNRLSKLPMLSAFGHKRSVDGVNLLDPNSFYFSLPGLPAMFSTQNSSGQLPTGFQTPQV